MLILFSNIHVGGLKKKNANNLLGKEGDNY